MRLWLKTWTYLLILIFFTENIIKQTIFSLINFFFNYDQVFLYSKSWNIIIFQILLKLLHQIILLMRVINLIEQFQQIMIKIFENFMSKITNLFINNIIVNKLKMKYDREMMLSKIWKYILEHLQNLDQVLFNIELAEEKVSEKNLNNIF